MNSSQSIYTYDANNKQTSELDQSWNDSIWVNSIQFANTYDANQFRLSQSYKTWNNAGIIIEGGDSTYSYYHMALGINDLKTPLGSITVYPNPSSNQITIRMTESLIKGQLSIIILNGQQLITRQITEPETQVDISNLPSGVYFVRLKSERTVHVGKFIKQ